MEEANQHTYYVSLYFIGHVAFLALASSVNVFLSVCGLGDMYNQEGDTSEPEWVKTEREQFTEFRDKNKDGKMDKEETRDWILPSDYDHAEAEAKHLVYESDADKVSTVK